MTDIQSILALGATASVTIPALVRVHRTRTGAGLSLGTQVANVTSAAMWIVYGAQKQLTTSIVSSVIYLIMACTLAAVAACRGGTRDTPAPAVAIAAGTAAAWIAGGTGALAIALGLTPLVAESSQIRRLTRSDAPALSTTSYAAATARAAAWIPYAAAERDLAIGLWSLCAITVSATVWAQLQHHRRTRQSRP